MIREDYAVALLLTMIFCHIIDDYYLQGFLASAKQKSWWEQEYPNNLYRHDYIMALAEHAFSWSFMIHLPLLISFIMMDLSLYNLFVSYFINWIIHMVVDDLKANKLKINLIQDQLIHLQQIMITWLILLNLV